MPFGIPGEDWNAMTPPQRRLAREGWLNAPAEGPLQEYDTAEVMTMPYGIQTDVWNTMSRNQREDALARWLAVPEDGTLQADGPLQEHDAVEMPFAGSGGLRTPLLYSLYGGPILSESTAYIPTPDETKEVQPTMPEPYVPGPSSVDYEPKYPFGKKSKEVRATLSPRLVLLVNKLADLFDISLIWGYRDEEQQTKFFNEGTGIEWPDSKHNVMPSKAVDLAPYPLDWSNITQKDIEQWNMILGAALAIAKEAEFEIRLGKNFSNVVDYPHIEEYG